MINKTKNIADNIIWGLINVIILSKQVKFFSEEKHKSDASVALRAVDNYNLDKTKVTYKVVVSGNKDNIDNIDSKESLINCRNWEKCCGLACSKARY